MKKQVIITENQITNATEAANVQLAKAIYNDQRLTSISRAVAGIRFATIEVVVNIDDISSTPHKEIRSNGVEITCHSGRAYAYGDVNKTCTTLEEAIEFITSNGCSLVALLIRDKWNGGKMECPKAKQEIPQGGKVMSSYKAGTCDFTGKEFAKGSQIIWYWKEKKVLAL